jgi:hypothetical protein
MAIRNQEMVTRYQPQAVQTFAGNQGSGSSKNKLTGWDGEGFSAAGKGANGERQQSPFFSGLTVNNKGDVKMPLSQFLAAVLQPVTASLVSWQRFGATQLTDADKAQAIAKKEWMA